MNFTLYFCWRIIKAIGIVVTCPVWFPCMVIGLLICWPIIYAVEFCQTWLADVKQDYQKKQDDKLGYTRYAKGTTKTLWCTNEDGCNCSSEDMQTCGYCKQI